MPLKPHSPFEVMWTWSSHLVRLVWLSLTRFCCCNWSLTKVTGSNWAAYGHLNVKWCLIKFTWMHESKQVTRNNTGEEAVDLPLSKAAGQASAARTWWHFYKIREKTICKFLNNREINSNSFYYSHPEVGIVVGQRVKETLLEVCQHAVWKNEFKKA